MTIDELKRVYDERKKEHDRKLSENAFIDKQILEKSAEMEKKKSSLKIGQDALSFIEEVAAARRGMTMAPIADV